MKNKELVSLLKSNLINLDQNILDEIKKKKSFYKKIKLCHKANYYWMLETIYLAKSYYISAYQDMKSLNFESAWNKLDNSDILISNLIKNVGFSIIDEYGLSVVRNNIAEFQKLFPYYLFLSREGIIKREVCSICNKDFKVHNGCKHQPGKVYMGEMCYAIVKDYELKSISIVTNPYDKYAILKVKGKEFNYSILEAALEKIDNPYTRIKVDRKYILKNNEQKAKEHTVEWLASIEQIQYSIDIKH